MPQISLYIDRETLERLEKAVKKEKTSISAWVSRRIREELVSRWPADYFNLFGSIDDETFVRHDPPPFRDDVKRETL